MDEAIGGLDKNSFWDHVDGLVKICARESQYDKRSID